MNILELTDGLSLGGGTRAMQVYCKYLNRERFNVYVCAFVRGGTWEKYFEKHSSGLIIAEENVNLLIDFIKKNKIELVYWFSYPPKSFNRDKIIRLFNYCKKNHIKIIERSSFVWFDETIDKLITIRFFISQACLNKFLFKYKSKIKNINKYSYIYNPLDLEEIEKYIISDREKLNLKKELGIKSNDFVIGKIARASIWKWSDEIIDVVPHLIKDIPNLKVVIRALPKQKLSKIKRMKIEKYFILLPETIDERELYSTYQILSVLVHTTRNGETFGTTLAEAMFFGIPIITNNTDFRQFTIFERDNAQVELVRNNKNGYVINSVKEMARKIIYLKKNKKLYALISNANKNKVKEEFDASKIIKKFLNITLDKGTSYTKLEDYDKGVAKDNLYSLFKTNTKTLFEYIVYIKLNI